MNREHVLFQDSLNQKSEQKKAKKTNGSRSRSRTSEPCPVYGVLQRAGRLNGRRRRRAFDHQHQQPHACARPLRVVALAAQELPTPSTNSNVPPWMRSGMMPWWPWHPSNAPLTNGPAPFLPARRPRRSRGWLARVFRWKGRLLERGGGSRPAMGRQSLPMAPGTTKGMGSRRREQCQEAVVALELHVQRRGPRRQEIRRRARAPAGRSSVGRPGRRSSYMSSVRAQDARRS
jgi:hypothetical protein